MLSCFGGSSVFKQRHTSTQHASNDVYLHLRCSSDELPEWTSPVYLQVSGEQTYMKAPKIPWSRAAEQRRLLLDRKKDGCLAHALGL